MKTLVYLVGAIPDNPSITPYNHALAIGEYHKDSVLITYGQPPNRIRQEYSDVRLINEQDPLNRIKSSIQEINRIDSSHQSIRVVSTLMFQPVVAGRFSRGEWAVDLYDDPMQGIQNNPISRHQVTDRIRAHLINTSPLVINTFPPESPFHYGKHEEYIINGSPVETISPGIQELSSPYKIILAGKTKLDKGLRNVLNGVSEIEEDILLNIYGEVNQEVKEYARDAGVSEKVIFHGFVPHSQVRQAITDAHAGLCVVPPRMDWKYSSFIKLGEYLAGGTVPIVSDFPGPRRMLGDAAIYVSPDKNGIISGIDTLSSIKPERYAELSRKARSRGEELSWEHLRERFAKLVTK